MMLEMKRRDATQHENGPIDIDWLLSKNRRIIKAVERTKNPTQAQAQGFRLGLKDRQVSYVRELAKLKRDRPKEYDVLMREYWAHVQGGAK